jgi:hypothetical protein
MGSECFEKEGMRSHQAQCRCRAVPLVQQVVTGARTDSMKSWRGTPQEVSKGEQLADKNFGALCQVYSFSTFRCKAKTRLGAWMGNVDKKENGVQEKFREGQLEGWPFTGDMGGEEGAE